MARVPVDGWYRSEQGLAAGAIAELQRLKRRAKARWVLILTVASALTALVMWRVVTKPRLYRAQVTIAILEGTMSDRRQTMPVQELHHYIASVLLDKGVLTELIEEWDLFPIRHTHGPEAALSELWDMIELGVHRNYFLYEHDPDAPRSARISLRVTAGDPELAWDLADELADLIIAREQERRQEAARVLVAEARRALDELSRRSEGLEQRHADVAVALTRAEDAGDRGRAAALRVELGEVDAELARAHETILTLTQQANADEMIAAINHAGLGLQLVRAAERRPEEDAGLTLYLRIILGTVLFSTLLPVVAVFIGAFDTRVHDREDVERLGLPVIGHLPAFPGDRVGSLRARGLRGRRVPS